VDRSVDRASRAIVSKRDDGAAHQLAALQLAATYSAHARGIDMLNTAYHYLDLVPKGRDEAGHEGGPQFATAKGFGQWWAADITESGGAVDCGWRSETDYFLNCNTT
jgi:predicted dithiol-disulfide oxidoreductase (DUF899 family)